jgi:hypothetical protein
MIVPPGHYATLPHPALALACFVGGCFAALAAFRRGVRAGVLVLGGTRRSPPTGSADPLSAEQRREWAREARRLGLLALGLWALGAWF